MTVSRQARLDPTHLVEESARGFEMVPPVADIDNGP